MANWEGTSRTNYFKVKDPAKFRAEVRTHRDLTLIENARGFGVYSNSGEGWPTLVDELGNELEDGGSVFEFIRGHLADGEVCVMMEAGHEKARYISGYACAFKNTGEQVQIQLDDIYSLAEKTFGLSPSLAQY